MRKIVASLLIIVSLFALLSCAGTRRVVVTVDMSSPVYSGIRGDSPVYILTVLDEEYRNPEGVYVIPFTENAVEVARQTNTFRVYFMSGTRQLNDRGEDVSYLGDCTLIVFPDGTTMLIDGGKYTYADTLADNIRKLGITELDYVVLSHMHSDHFGVLFCSGGIFDSFKVGTFIWSGCDNGAAATLANFDRAVKSRGVNMVTVHRGDSFNIGDVRIDIYGPSADVEGKSFPETPDMNNASIVMKMTFGDFKALFAGDLYVEGEKETMAANSEGSLDADLVKANHHGRVTSNSTEWINATSPKVMFSSTIPNDTVYMGYAKAGARVISEYMDDYTRVVSDGYNCEVTTSRARGKNKLYDMYDQLSSW